MFLKQENIKLGILAFLFVTSFFIWEALIENGKGLLTVAFLDVGQGDSIFIEGPSGRQMLIDGGSGSAVLREVSKMMPFYDRSIDIVLSTHPDKDHIGGLPDVLSRYDTDFLFRSGAVNDTGAYRELNKFSETVEKELIARRGMIVHLGGGAYVEILSPDRDVRGVDPNDASVVTRIVYGDTEFLLTGDAPKNIEEYIVSLDGDRLESDVLKIGHHGSKTSTSEFFLGFVSPQYAVISAGLDNSYGHPHKEVTDLLLKFDVPFLNTAEEGTIVFETDGETLSVR